MHGTRFTTRVLATLTLWAGFGLTAYAQLPQLTADKAFEAKPRQPGVAVLLSDFFDPEWQEGVKALLARGFQVGLVHVLEQEEMNPSLRGDLRIIDSETGEAKEMSVNPGLLSRYQQALAAFRADVETFCRRYGLDYFFTVSNDPFENVILQTMRRGGILK